MIARATGKSVGENLQDRIWSKLGAEQDAYFAIDTVGTEFAGGGLSTGLRDLARFGEIGNNVPDLAEKFFAWYNAVFADGALSAREKSLIALAVASLACPSLSRRIGSNRDIPSPRD